MKKGIKYIVVAVLALIALYNSVYFLPLDKKLSEEREIVFNADSYVADIWGKELQATYDSAAEFASLLDQLHSDPVLAFKNHANALAIGNIGYFRVKGEGVVTAVGQNNVMMEIGGHTVEIETEFIFGNAIRDASRLIRVSDFDKTSDLNSISESINAKIRKEAIPAFRAKVEIGDKVVFTGAIELNQAHLNLGTLEIIPLSLKIIS